MRGNLIELVLRQVVQALVGAFVPGAENAFDQLAAWAANIPLLGPIVEALTGIIDGDLNALSNWANNIPSDVVDNVALDPGKFFAEAMNVTGITALWVNTIEPLLRQALATSPVFNVVDQWINGILGVTSNPTGNTGGSLAQAAVNTATDTASAAVSNTAHAINSAITNTLTAGSPSASYASDAVASAVNSLASSNSETWNMPIPQSLAELISNITFGHIQFYSTEPGTDFVHLFLGPAPDPPPGIPASWHQNLNGTPPPTTTPPPPPASGDTPLPIPQALADFLTKITGGYLSFWWADDGSWIHGDEPIGGVVWQQHHVGGSTSATAVTDAVTAPVTNVVSNVLAPVTKAVSSTLASGSPTATSTSAAVTAATQVASALTTNTNSAWNMPIPQSIAELISNLTFGHIQFYSTEPGTDFVHLFLGPAPDPPPGIPASWHQNLDGTPPPKTTPPPTPATEDAPLPIPSWLADFLTKITGGYLSFWWADDGSWIHGDEPIGGVVWQQHHVGGSTKSATAAITAPVSNVVSNVAAMAAPAVAAVANAANAAAPAKGITGEGLSVFQNLLGLFANPTGSSFGSVIAGAIAQLQGGGDVMSNITSALVQAFTDAAAGNLSQADLDISSRFGDSSLGTLLTDIVGIVTNPTGSNSGSIPQSIWQSFWKFINCNGVTGGLFSSGNNLTGLFDNPTGSSTGGPIGTLVGYVTDLSNTLFGQNGKGLSEVVTLAQQLLGGDLLGALGTLIFGGAGGVLSHVMSDLGGILNFFSNPTLPSPTSLATGAKTAAASVASTAASAVGLGSETGGISGAVANFTSDFMGTLGNPSGLGTGNVTLNPLDQIPILGPILEALFSGLGGTGTPTHTGLLGILESIPLIGPLIDELPSLLAGIIGPGANSTLLPDSNFATLFGTDIAGQGDWMWAWPGKDLGAWGGPGCVRTVRPGLTTVYFVTGTWEILPGITSMLGFQSGGPLEGDPIEFLKALASSAGFRDGVAPGDSILDWSRFELIAVPYAGATYPMGQTEAQGVAELTSLINSIPGKFVMIGHSQGGCVVSDVYDSLRTGGMQARNDDLLMGVGIGNMRHPKGASFPGGPVYCPDGSGCFTPLQNTEARWWEWAVAAGTYPGNGQLDGVTYPEPDPVCCLGDDTTSQQIRKIIASTMSAKSINIATMVEEVFALLTQPGGKELMNGLNGTGPHSTSPFDVQPFLSQGDTRSFWEYLLDSINALPTAAPAAGTRHQLESKRISVAPGAVVAIGAYAKWMNVSCRGPAIMVGLNCYDANGNLLSTPSALRDPYGNLIVSAISHSTAVYNPATDSDGWQHLTDQFVIPANTSVATLVFNVEPDAMTTGIVAFDDASFTITSGTIDAGQLGNISNIPAVPPQNVGGIQGAESSLVTMQSTLDGLASAFAGDSLTDVAFSQTFSAASKIASATKTALDALPTINSRLAALEQKAGIPSPPVYQGPEEIEFTTTGAHTYSIPGWMQDGDKLAVAILGAGAAGVGTVSGTPGSWTGAILTKGTDFPSATTELTVTIGAPGGAITVFPFTFPGDFGEAGDGAPSTVSATGMTTLTANGGVAGAGTGPSGQGPGSYTIPSSPLGKTYFGGPTVAAGSPGGTPGGGGAGADTTPGAHAAPGAPGYGSITAYQGS